MPQLLSIHVMSICRGSKNDITGCSFLRVPVHFLPIPVSANMQGVPSVKHEIAWPEYVMDRLATLAQTSRLMSIFYLIATGASGLSSSYWISSFRRGNLSWHVHTAPAQSLASHPDMPPSLVEFLSLVVSQRPCCHKGSHSDLRFIADRYVLYVCCVDYCIDHFGGICISDQH